MSKFLFSRDFFTSTLIVFHFHSSFYSPSKNKLLESEASSKNKNGTILYVVDKMVEVINLNQLEKGVEIDTVLAIKDKHGVKSYKGGNFFSLELGNRTGEIRAKYWGGGKSDVQKVHDELKVGDIVKVKGRVDKYRGNAEIALNPDKEHFVKPTEPGEYNVREFLPQIEKNPEHLFSDISRKIRKMENDYLRKICMKFYGDKEIAPQLKELPAAKSYHHNRIGGYIEHIHETMELAETFCKQHDRINREQLLTGVFLHDIGKINEYEYKAAIDFTDDGRLLGHIPMGDHMVTEAIQEIDGFPKKLARKIRHMILSHHGQKEWGSAVEPRTKEAIILHELEYLDSKVSKVIGTFRKHEGSKESGVFDPALNQYIYLK